MISDPSLPTAVVLAGNRPGGDPLARAAGVPTKALVPIAGEPMINHVLRALLASPQVGRVLVLAQEPGTILADPAAAWIGGEPRVTMRVSGQGISQSLLDLLDTADGAPPLLVTTADNVLLTADMIADFIADARGADVAAGLVEYRGLMARFPESKRTWLKFRRGWWSGANLFWLGSTAARAPVAFWRGVEQDRKKGRKLIAAFGPGLLLGATLRLLTIDDVARRAGRRLGVLARVVKMRRPESCIDADKPVDVVLIEQILAERAAQT